ncbi:MAG: acetate--CoA ligase family protein [Immundisolibacteraceae bacterium]|nr:acetate--CoA ligase family protein [Immundisolibacteraceae bacterium]
MSIKAGLFDHETLERFFNPKVVAAIVASPDTLWSRQILEGLKNKGFQGNTYVVNPSRSSVLGFQSVPSVADLPEAPDVAAILLGAKHVPRVLREVAATGCKAAYVLASGFESPESLAELRKVVDELGMIVIGPNCNGFINAGAGLHLWTGPINRPYMSGNVALLGQSSGVMGAMCASVWDRGMGISFQISTGNQVNFALTDALHYLATNADTKVVVTYVEQFGDYPHFVEAVQKCRANNTPVVVVPVGRSESARSAALGHTGAITTTGAVSQAAVEAAGAIYAPTIDEALDRASMFAAINQRAWRPVRSAAVISISGGWSALAADVLADEGIATPPLPESVTSKLPAHVENVTFNNPFDITAQLYAWSESYFDIVDEMCQAEEFDAVTVMFGNWDGGERFYAPINAWAGRLKKPIFASSIESTAIKETYREWVKNDPMPMVNGGVTMARGLAAMRDYFDKPGYLPEGWCSDDTTAWTGAEIATYPEMAPVLKGYGLAPVDFAVLVDSDGSSPQSVGQFPVVVKLESAEMPHKTEHGAVRVGVADADAMANHVEELTALASSQGLKTWKVIAQQMVDFDDALELLVGVVNDHVAGPVITLGAGGIFAELMDKHSHSLCPITTERAEAMVDEIGVGKILDGYRGRAELDRESLITTLVAVAEFAYQHRDSMQELDLNPVMVPAKGTPTAIVDALASFNS